LRAEDLRLAFDLWLALGGWFPAVGRDIRFVPDGFSRAAQERGQQSGASQTCRSGSQKAPRSRN